MARTRDLALPAEELTCREELAAPAGRPGLVLILPAAALFLLAAVCIAREAGAVRPLYTAAMLAEHPEICGQAETKVRAKYQLPGSEGASPEADLEAEASAGAAPAEGSGLFAENGDLT